MFYIIGFDRDSSANSSQSSVGIDDYWDEALVDDYGSTQNDDSDDLDGHNN
ncbi:GL19270 [Drosophila persimilis]|uniref:GL19270 n=1 Tax=Drosophila persimilis TaxID=7234 RepID=B4G8B4_DROPE|nr:GL19270 [Drosophila persimilis]